MENKDATLLKDKKNKKRKKFRNKHLDPMKLLDIKESDAEPMKKIKRKRSISSNLSEKCDKSNISTKKFKNNTKKNSVDLQQIQAQNSNESDEDELRSELKSSSIFKNIQKLLKNNPSLMSSVSSIKDELIETESKQSSSESELDELSIECEDDVNSNSTDNESEIALKKLSNKKVEPVSKKGFDRTPKEYRVNENEGVASSSASSSNFNRTRKDSFENKDGKKISEKATTLRNKAYEKLQGAKFRYLNEKLYTESGKDSFNYFQENKDEYMDYHKGYSLQVTKWPLNPVDKIISSLQKMKKNTTIADMGCGDAKIARTLSNYTVHSFDLIALNDFVTSCNIAKVPLSNESVDVVVFCLSLMGTNLKEYLQEACRIVKLGGILKIAEVDSRIPNLDQFIKGIESIGFSMEKKNVEHKLFVFLEFKKAKKKKKAKVQDITLKPCLYKKR